MHAAATTAVFGPDPLQELRKDPGAIADLAFGSRGGSCLDGSSLSLLTEEALVLDLSDPQQRHLGDYELIELIGEGGMGVVYRARQQSLDREVAVKLLAAGPWASRDFVQRFVHEAQNAARMQHPNIVTIYEVGCAEELHFFSMRLIQGESLAALLKRDGKLAPQRAAALLRTIAEAVHYAHRLGVLHLDLKPANVLLDENGVPHVADFGLARRLEQGLAADNHEVSGTPSYMAPEQATAGAQRITPATDIWGLGAILYELLSGEPPFISDTPQATLKLVVEGKLRSPRRFVAQLPRDLEAIVLKCMAYDCVHRYASAGELAEDLTRFQNGYMVKARPLNTVQRSARWAMREPKILATAMFALFALLLGLAATTVQWRRANANAERAAQERALAEKNAAVSRQRLWDGRRSAAQRLMRDGNGFASLPPLLANIEEMHKAGKANEADLERREIGMIEQQGVTLIDRLIIPEAHPMSTALSADGRLMAVTLNDLSVRWYDTTTLTEQGRLDLLDDMDGDQVPILARFVGDHRLLVFGEWFSFLPNPSTSDAVLIDLDSKQAITPPKSFAHLADITWASDARHALLHDTDHRVQLWQVEPWRALSPLSPALEMVGSLWVLDPHLRYAVQFGRNFSELRLFDPHRLDAPRPVPVPPHESFSAWAASGDGLHFAVGTSNGQLFVIDTRSLAVRQIPVPLGNRASWLSFSEDDAWLAAAFRNGSAFVYDMNLGEQVHAGPIQSDFDATRVEIDHRHHLLILSGQIASGTGDAQVWRLPTSGPMLGNAIRLIASPSRDGRAGPYWMSTAPRAGLIASASMDGEVRLWRLPKPSTLEAMSALFRSDNLYTDGNHVVDVAYDRLRVVNAVKNSTTPWLPLPAPIGFAELSADGKTLVAVARTQLHILDANTLQSRIPAIELDNTPQHMAMDAAGNLAAMSFNHNGPKGFQERLRLYELTSGRRLDRDDIAFRGPLRQFELSPDATRLLATGPPDGATQVLDTRTQNLSLVYPNDPAQPVIWAAFTSDSRNLWMVTRNTDDTQANNAELMRSSLRDGKIVERRHVPGVYPIGIAAVRDKPLLAGRDRLILDPGAPDVFQVTGLHGGEATTVFAVSHDGRMIAHAFGGEIQLYDASDLDPIGPPMNVGAGQMNNVSSIAFSGDDRRLLTRVDPPIAEPWRLWPVADRQRNAGELRDEAALVLPREAAPRILPFASIEERARLRARDPGPPPIPEARPLPVVVRWLGTDPIPARSPAAGPLQIDLGGVYNRAPASQVNVMNSVLPVIGDSPIGMPRIDGVDYDFRGAVEMRQDGEGISVGSRNHRFEPKQVVRGLRVPAQPIAALHILLYASQVVGEPRERAYANVRLHYRDGSQAVLPLRTQREVKGWTEHDRPTPIGWAQGDGLRILGLMSMEAYNNPRLVNPHPEKIIATVDLETVEQPFSLPVFFAITAEPVIAASKSGMNSTGTESGTEAGARDGHLQPSTNREMP